MFQTQTARPSLFQTRTAQLPVANANSLVSPVSNASNTVVVFQTRAASRFSIKHAAWYGVQFPWLLYELRTLSPYVPIMFFSCLLFLPCTPLRPPLHPPSSHSGAQGVSVRLRARLTGSPATNASIRKYLTLYLTSYMAQALTTRQKEHTNPPPPRKKQEGHFSPGVGFPQSSCAIVKYVVAGPQSTL